jgi:rRNA maturation RNase YbeY
MAFPVIEMNREKKYLGGEIYVCVPVAIANAKRWQEPPRRELMRLVVHGFLHLLGYSDHNESQRSKMWVQQEKWMKEC